MKNHQLLPIALLGLLISSGLGLQLWYWPQLPDRLAIHFDVHGQPNDWADRSTATLLSVGLVSILPLFFVGISQLMRWLPTSMVNLPNREYWLGPNQREKTLRWMTSWMLWFSALITLVVITINHLTFVANRDSQPLSQTWFWGMLGMFMSTVLAMVVVMIRRFGSPPKFNNDRNLYPQNGIARDQS